MKLPNDQIVSASTRALLAPIGTDIISLLTEQKFANKASLWNSTRVSAQYSAKDDLQLVTKLRFDSKDYFQDLIDQAQTTQDTYQTPVIAFSAISFLFASLLVPTLPIPVAAKNILGLIGLFGPLLFIGLNIISPGFRLSMQSASSSKAAIDKIDRIAYHEAGHFLAGYLLGIPILSYDINGESDAGTTIATDSTPLYVDDKLNIDFIGALLVISMSGIVAETLRLGRSLGGSEDFSLAYSLLRESKIPSAKRDGYLRNAVLNSLTLLVKHRDSLDEVAGAMKEYKSLSECFEAIEKGNKM